MKQVTVRVPHRISGFFEIVDHVLPENPTMEELATIGSRGGGPCLSLCGETMIKLQANAKDGRRKIFIDGVDQTRLAGTTISVLNRMLPDEQSYDIEISHEFPLLSGAGYGSSGSGAIGVAVGLNMLLNLGYSLDMCGKFAHCAEVENKTGLGTVGGQITGGCTISMVPGYPFKFNSILLPPGLKIACGTRGGISTSQMLSDKEVRANVIKAGRVAMKSIDTHYSIENFMKTAIRFVNNAWVPLSEELDLGDVINIMDDLNQSDKHDILGASMNQMGRSVYCIYRKQKTLESQIIDKFNQNEFKEIKICDFSLKGPEIIQIKEM